MSMQLIAALTCSIDTTILRRQTDFVDPTASFSQCDLFIFYHLLEFTSFRLCPNYSRKFKYRTSACFSACIMARFLFSRYFTLSLKFHMSAGHPVKMEKGNDMTEIKQGSQKERSQSMSELDKSFFSLWRVA